MSLKFLFFVLPGTILHGACSYGSIPCAEVLLANGAEVNAFSAIGLETPLIQTRQYPRGIQILVSTYLRGAPQVTIEKS